MTWRDGLRRVNVGGRELIGASFRGVPFFVENSDRSSGRRTVVHEFPLRDDPYVEDLGRRARTFRVDGYVLGDDYLSQRDALLDALENTAGPGELVHPYHGTLRAIATTCNVRSTRADGGMAAFTIEFTETPLQVPAPIGVDDGAEQVSASADVATIATDAEFADQYDPEGLPAFALASAEAAITKAAAALLDKLGPVVGAAQELAQLKGQLELVTAEASSLARSPADVLGAFRTAMIGLFTTILAAPGDVMNGLFDAYAADFGPIVTATTSTRTRELANQTALTSALRRVFAIQAARLAPLVAYASSDDAIAARDQVAAMLDEQAATADDVAYPALVDLRAQVLRAVPGTSAFASVVTVTRAVPIPSLLLAYQLYGSVDAEPDIVARNGIRHPGFVAGDLKVLSDG